MSDKRTQLEKIAIEAVQESGFSNLSFRTLAEKVGVKSSSVHYYFPEKSHLAAALIEKYTKDLQTRLKEIDNTNEPIRLKLKAFAQIFREVIESDKFCLCGMLAAEVATLSDENRKLLSQYFKIAEKWLATLLKDNADQVNYNIGAQSLAKIILSGLEGAILIDRVDASIERLDAQQEFIDSLVKTPK